MFAVVFFVHAVMMGKAIIVKFVGNICKVFFESDVDILGEGNALLDAS